jgi:hypothetical protein
MRQKRDLAENVWYGVETAVNVGEPLFRLGWTTVIFGRVLLDAKERFEFEMHGLVLSGALLSFYIKPADGYELPKIMQWMKQTFSCRFNVKTGRSGHVWGDRYKSEILPGEPPPGAEEVDWGPAVMLLSSVAVSLPPHRGAVFKQCPQCFGRGFGWGGGDGPERDSGVHTLQTVMGLSPLDGNRGKSRGFAQMRFLCLVPAG